MTEHEAMVERRMDDESIIRLCRERAVGYGALRWSSPTAIALDQAASRIASLGDERARIVEWLDRELAEYPGTEYALHARPIRDAIERGDHIGETTDAR